MPFSDMELMKAAILQSKFPAIDSASYLLDYEQWEIVIPTLVEFVNRTPLQPPSR